jgi:uncharacterized protein
MNRILILSDSHGETESLADIRKRHEIEVELMIHCGDSELSSVNQAIHGFSVVRGNCDYDARFPDELVEQCGSYRLFITHGHLYSVKSTLMNLYYRSKEAQAQIVCFGHSHILGAEMFEGTLFINPGSTLLPRMRKEKTYVILELEVGKARVRVFETDGTEIVELEREFVLAE